MTTPRLSVVTIVLNEEKILPACLKSVRLITVPHEHIVLVDSRSTDRTLDIAKAEADRWFILDWPDSFAEAANRGFAEARGEYILRLDADERLARPDIIDRLLTDPRWKDVNGFGFTTVQCRKDGTVTSESPILTRLVKRGVGYRYHGRIHEQLYIGDDPTTGDNRVVAVADQIIIHYGYDQTLLTEKVERNNRLAAMDAWDDDNPIGLYHLARTHAFAGDTTESRRYALMALSESDRLSQPVVTHCLELLGK